MFVVSRFDVEPDGADDFLADAQVALAALAARPGYRSGRVGRSLDVPSVWTITTAWEGVGAYRRALSAYDVKVGAAPLLGLARDEPSAFETLLYDDGVAPITATSDRASDAREPGSWGGHPR